MWRSSDTCLRGCCRNATCGRRTTRPRRSERRCHRTLCAARTSRWTCRGTELAKLGRYSTVVSGRRCAFPPYSMRPQISFLLLFITAAVVGAAAGSFLVPLNGNRHGIRNEAWRRTASGWELASSWQIPVNGSTTHRTASNLTGSHAPSLRLDTHPAALALLQLMAVFAALACCSRRSPLQAGMAGLPAIISRSFRASFFGS